MAAPLTPIDPRPFVGFSVTLPDTLTVVELDPQPYSNTKEVLLYNASTTDAAYVQVAYLQGAPASGLLRFGSNGGSGASGPPVVGDTLTINTPNPAVLTAISGNQVSGANNFSAPTPAQFVITINAPPFSGSRITINAPGAGYSEELTATPGGGGAGTKTFDNTGLPGVIAISLANAINDNLNDLKWGVADANFPALGQVTVWGYTGFNGSRRPGMVTSFGVPWDQLLIKTTAPVAITVPTTYTAPIAAQVQPDSPVRDPVTGTYNPDDANSIGNVSWNVITAIRDPANAWVSPPSTLDTDRIDVQLPADYYAKAVGTSISTTAGSFYLVAYLNGTAGNAITYSASTPFPPPPAAPNRIEVGAGTFTGGTDALPTAASITAANSTLVPALSAVTLAIGSEGNRQPLGTSIFWAAYPGSGLGIVMKAATGTNIDVNVTYVQNRGYPDGV